MQDFDQRQHVIAVAKKWLGTPYHPMGRVKGAGVDCLTLLAEIYHEAGMIEKLDIPYYPPDWHLHRGNERYLEGLLRYTHEVHAPQPADIALWKFGRCFSHGAIVINWPEIIHAYTGRACVLENVNQAEWLMYSDAHKKRRKVRFFSLF